MGEAVVATMAEEVIIRVEAVITRAEAEDITRVEAEDITRVEAEDIITAEEADVHPAGAAGNTADSGRSIAR